MVAVVKILFSFSLLSSLIVITVVLSGGLLVRICLVVLVADVVMQNQPPGGDQRNWSWPIRAMRTTEAT